MITWTSRAVPKTAPCFRVTLDGAPTGKLTIILAKSPLFPGLKNKKKILSIKLEIVKVKVKAWALAVFIKGLSVWKFNCSFVIIPENLTDNIYIVDPGFEDEEYISGYKVNLTASLIKTE